MKLAAGRLAAISVRGAAAAGGWVGFTLGIVLGALVGALLAWFAGAALSWQRDLELTLGVTTTLLPFGDQIPALRWVSSAWYLFIPATALALSLLGALLGALIGALLAAVYNRSPRRTAVWIEMLDSEPAAPPPRGSWWRKLRRNN